MAIELVDPECFAGLSPDEQEQQFYIALGGDPACFLSLSREARREAIYVAAGGAEACFLGRSREEQDQLLYGVLYANASDTETLIDPACFAGLSPDIRESYIFAAASLGSSAPEPEPDPPELESATIEDNGTTLALLFDEVVDFGAGGNAGWTITLSGAAATLVYASGSGTNTLLYTISRTIAVTETATLDYVQPTDGVENALLTDLASIVAGAVTNNSVYDADVINWFETRVPAAGGTTATGTRLAVNTFTLAAKANAYWTKLNRINLFCGDQLAAALVPLKVGAGGATDTNVNFVGGDYSLATGLTGNGTTKYINTGLLANALTVNDTHLAVYNRSSVAANGGAHIGSSAFLIYAPFTDGTAYSDHYSSGARISAAIAGPYGFVVSSRIASNDHALYRNGGSIATGAVDGGAIPTIAFFVFAHNSAGTPSSATSHNLAAYSIGSGLTSGNVTSYNTDMEAFQDALGRGVQ